MTPEQFDRLITALNIIAGAIVFHAIMSPPSMSGVVSALGNIANALRDKR